MNTVKKIKKTTCEYIRPFLNTFDLVLEFRTPRVKLE